MLQEKSRILIVDDERININILNNALKNDYLIKVAMNGTQALDRAVSHPRPDLILLDIIMPEPDGFKVCRQLKSNPETRDIPSSLLAGKIQRPMRSKVWSWVAWISSPNPYDRKSFELESRIT